MRIANTYDHLNAEEFLLCRKENLYEEIKECIKDTDANQCLKISSAKTNIGQIIYDQKQLNSVIKDKLNSLGWKSKRVHYYVTGDEDITRKVVNIADEQEQKKEILDSGNKPYSTNNEVDFQKDRVAVEVQFGKYFSVAYDLHVKHTFFYMRNDIDVGIEIIPTRALETHMDSGVAWFENEVTNVIREGRTNPMVPILVIGIEPDKILSRDPCDYLDKDLEQIIKASDITKFQHQANLMGKNENLDSNALDRVKKIQANIH